MCARVGEISYGINSMRERIHDGNELPRWVRLAWLLAFARRTLHSIGTSASAGSNVRLNLTFVNTCLISGFLRRNLDVNFESERLLSYRNMDA